MNETTKIQTKSYLHAFGALDTFVAVFSGLKVDERSLYAHEELTNPGFPLGPAKLEYGENRHLNNLHTLALPVHPSFQDRCMAVHILCKQPNQLHNDVHQRTRITGVAPSTRLNECPSLLV